jgi:hypothetical protein
MKRVAKNVTRHSPRSDTGSDFARQFVVRSHLSELEMKQLLLGESSKLSLTAHLVICLQHKGANQWHKLKSTTHIKPKIRDCLLAQDLTRNQQTLALVLLGTINRRLRARKLSL